MEWITNKTQKCKENKRTSWHRWFAWKPVTVHVSTNGAKTKSWLVTVLRKGQFNEGEESGWWTYEYKNKGTTSNGTA